jgi:N-acetylglucosamine kinase-like BadF-type ATPase
MMAETGLTVTPGAAGTLFTHCGDARRADGYRFTVMDAMSGAILASVLTQDAGTTFSGLTSGTKVKVIVTARNSTGESQPCDAVSVVVP